MNLGRTIDRVIKIEPALKDALLAIRKKSSRNPRGYKKYWGEFLSVINNYSTSACDPDIIAKIKRALTITHREHKISYSFEEPGPQERVVGALPEYLSDRMKKLDRIGIDLAKTQVEVNITRNKQLMADFSRRASETDIKQKKMWHDIRDYFQLWDKEGSYSIRIKGPLLVLTERTSSAPAKMSENRAIQMPRQGLVQMDPEMLRRFMQFLGMPPPPEIPGDEEEEST